MAKKKPDEPPKGCPAWQGTFADLMNLLLCFFVLLFSMSSVDAQKFELIAASFSQTFSVLSGGASAIGDGMLVSNGVSQLNELSDYINSMGSMADSEGVESLGKDGETDKEAFEEEQKKVAEELAERIQETVNEENLQNDIDVNFTSQYVLLTMNGALLFDSGKPEIREEALPIMSKVATILDRYAEHTIEVEGHTDNVPLKGGRYGNNDELSSFRALAVFNYLVDNTDLEASHIKHSGRGEYVPIADNSTPEGRAKNRRVEIKIYHALSAEP